jgi:hypothetical protein
MECSQKLFQNGHSNDASDNNTNNNNITLTCSNNDDDAILASLSLLQHAKWHPNCRQYLYLAHQLPKRWGVFGDFPKTASNLTVVAIEEGPHKGGKIRGPPSCGPSSMATAVINGNYYSEVTSSFGKINKNSGVRRELFCSAIYNEVKLSLFLWTINFMYDVVLVITNLPFISPLRSGLYVGPLAS